MRTFEEFDNEYEALTLPEEGDDPDSGTLLWSWDAVLAIPDERVWSVIEDEDHELVVVPGRLRNTDTLDYAVTERPWQSTDLRFRWLPAGVYHDSEGVLHDDGAPQ